MDVEIPIALLHAAQAGDPAAAAHITRLPTDDEYLMSQAVDARNREAPACRNYTAGNPVQDWESQDYRNTDRSAGGGDGTPCEPPKIDTY